MYSIRVGSLQRNRWRIRIPFSVVESPDLSCERGVDFRLEAASQAALRVPRDWHRRSGAAPTGGPWAGVRESCGFRIIAFFVGVVLRGGSPRQNGYVTNPLNQGSSRFTAGTRGRLKWRPRQNLDCGSPKNAPPGKRRRWRDW